MAQSELVARGVNFDGTELVVNKETHDRALAGGATETYSVTVNGTVYGFGSREDVEQFLFDPNENEYTDKDNYGNDVVSKRKGLGVASGMVAFYDTNDNDDEPEPEPEVYDYTGRPEPDSYDRAEYDRLHKYFSNDTATTPVPGSQGENTAPTNGDATRPQNV